MVEATEETALKMFEAIYGKMTGSCSAEVIYDDYGEMLGVACIKDGQKAWVASLAELAFDIAAKLFLANEAAQDK